MSTDPTPDPAVPPDPSPELVAKVMDATHEPMSEILRILKPVSRLTEDQLAYTDYESRYMAAREDLARAAIRTVLEETR